MIKAFVNSIIITKDDTRTLENVLEIVVQNYTNAPISFTHKNVTRMIPAVHSTLGIPVAPFTINAHGNPFDIEIDIAFATKDGGKVILDYTTIKTC